MRLEFFCSIRPTGYLTTLRADRSAVFRSDVSESRRQAGRRRHKATSVERQRCEIAGGSTKTLSKMTCEVALVRKSAHPRCFSERFIRGDLQIACPVEALAQHVAVRWNARGSFESAGEVVQ
jgi:hypothetical protein